MKKAICLPNVILAYHSRLYTITKFEHRRANYCLPNPCTGDATLDENMTKNKVPRPLNSVMGYVWLP